MKRNTGIAVLAAGLLTAAGVGAAGGWFTDVPDDHRRAAAIRYARTEGLFQGFPDGRFAPDEELRKDSSSKWRNACTTGTTFGRGRSGRRFYTQASQD